MAKKFINKALRAAGKTVKILMRFMDDIFLAAGIGLLAYGIFLIYVPAGYITLGICFLALAFFIAKKGVIADAYAKLDK